MKRFLTIGLMALATAGAEIASAQSKRLYDDDIYYNSKQKAADEEAAARERRKAQDSKAAATTQQDDARSYESGSDQSYASSDYDADYVDYDDDFSYATQFSRFNSPYYNRPYWSSFYNPNWYNPYWVDPYWGYNPWMGSGIGISFGAGPYWSSYWGYNTWFGYGGFNSYYYPGYAWGGGWGGWGGGYYGNYWNGYYGGLYGGGGYGYRNVTYGPRFSMNANRNNILRGSTYTPATGGRNPLIGGQRIAPSRNTPDRMPVQSQGAQGRDLTRTGIDAGTRPDVNMQQQGGFDRPNRNFNTAAPAENPGRNRFNGGRVSDNNAGVQPQPGRGTFQQAPSDRAGVQQAPDRGSFQQAPDRGSFQQAPRQAAEPRSFESAPRSYSAPQRAEPATRSFDGGGNRGGFGGGGNSGGRSGGFGGGGGGGMRGGGGFGGRR